MSHFKVEEVSRRDELDGIVDCIWAVMEKNDSAHQVFYPILSDRETAVNESKERLWNEHKSDPSSHWVFVRDPSSKSLKVLGACQWRIYEHNPFPEGMPDIQATWWPAGEGRNFATEFVRQCLSPRTKEMAKPHAGLSWCVVLPEHQRKGIGYAIMAWGLQLIDMLGLESYIEATSAGRNLYERCGYRVIARVDINMDGKNGSKEWKRLVNNLLPSGFDSMWRPPYGTRTKEMTQRSQKE